MVNILGSKGKVLRYDIFIISNVTSFFFNIKSHDLQRENTFAIKQTHNIRITFVQRRPNILDVGQTLYKRHTNVCWEHTSHN